VIVDLFCGAGGASVGMALLGYDVVGVDHDPDSCATHLAAGHPTVRADLTAPVPLTGPFGLVWASPPCTAFSMAGKGAGRDVADVLVARILAEDWSPMDADPTVWLVLPTMRALLDLRPVAVCMENVPPTLPVMHACARVLERHGWNTAVGVLSAERFGVAQTRKRAFLVASRERRVSMPEPTHQGYGDEVDGAQGSLFGEPLLPWVSMADALGWSDGRVARKMMGAGLVERHGDRPDRTLDDPSFSVRANGGGNATPGFVWAMDRRTISRGPRGTKVPTVTVPVTSPSPSPSLTSSGVSGQFVWVHERPSTTLVSSFRPDVVAGPGYRQAGDGPRQDAPGSISISEAARLQAFPNGHPWRGSRTSQFRQCGNAVPPPVAAAVAGAALGVDWRPAVADYLTELYVPLAEVAA
jgi:DNA (cytosine-5)-methyltransferase 1